MANPSGLLGFGDSEDLDVAGCKSLLYLHDDESKVSEFKEKYGNNFRFFHVSPDYRQCNGAHCFKIMSALDHLERPTAVVCRSGKRASVIINMHDKATKGSLKADDVGDFCGTDQSCSDWARHAIINYNVILDTGLYNHMGIRQMFEKESSTFTYLLWDTQTKDAIVIDPVDIVAERDASVIKDLGLNLLYAINTHVHADHITGTAALKNMFPGCKSVLGLGGMPAKADRYVKDGERIEFGTRCIEAIATPGHTSGCTSFVTDDRSKVFTGDTLFIRGCGRTDFQQGSSTNLFHSVRDKIFSLPESCMVFPAHNYKGLQVSTIAEEQKYNPRLKLENNEEAFIKIMDALKLSYPKKN
eukprot:m.19848 g.19848  ORF g.19848 m.19848 type:complete len:357 (+) comp6690_c0_seq1:173-1243(+)